MTPYACFAHRKRLGWRVTTGRDGAERKSVGGASGWSHLEAGGLALEGVGKNSLSSWPLPAPWQSPGMHTDTDMLPLV